MQANRIILPAFGATIPGQGGAFAAILRAPRVDDAEQPPYALIVSGAAVGEFLSQWGEYGKDVAGAKSRTDGRGNTEAMADAECPAALRVRELRIDGHADWFMPSLGELNSAAANVPELFDAKGIYFTSTQGSRSLAFVQDFEYGDSGWNDKDNECRVRACRAIPLDLLTA